MSQAAPCRREHGQAAKGVWGVAMGPLKLIGLLQQQQKKKKNQRPPSKQNKTAPPFLLRAS